MPDRRRTLGDIMDVLREQMPELRRRYGVRYLGVFGSWVRSEQTGASDLDLLVDFDERPLSLLDFIGLENHLGDLLGIKVDLVERNALKPSIGRYILEEARVV